MEKYFLVLMLLCLAAMPAQAAPVAPLSYDMLNGDGQAHGGSYNYWDKFYTGTGNTTTDQAPLSGGLGDLTDGVIATQSWNFVENVDGTGPYVGWVYLDPTITFHFDGTVTINTVHLSVDYPFQEFGHVAPPASIDVVMGTNSQTFTIVIPTDYGPYTIALSLSGWSGDTLSITLHRSNDFVFLSEVQFDGNPVPLPSTMLLLGPGLLGLAGWRRFRKG